MGDILTGQIDWARRYRHMRAHTAMHLLCAAIPFPVTGGQVGEARGRLDFDADSAIDKDAVEARLNALVAGDHKSVCAGSAMRRWPPGRN